MSWYYTREPGAEGQILTEEGTPTGAPLADLLRGGSLPLRAGLELVASLADIVSIAEEDGAIHGDIDPAVVIVDAAGACSVAGYGQPRRSSRAPEGAPRSHQTDVYGLGGVLFAVLAGGGLGAVPRDRDAHDDHVVGRLLTLDWGELADKPWMQDVQSFLCSMLAFDPAERPAPLDVANVLFHVADQAPGGDLASWAARAIGGGGRGGRRATPSVDEQLGGPQQLGGPVSQTQTFKVRQAASAKGESTAFWSREKIAAMLAEDEDEAPARPAPAPAAAARGGGAPPPMVPPPRGAVDAAPGAPPPPMVPRAAQPQLAPPPAVAPPPPPAGPPGPIATAPPGPPVTPFAVQGPIAAPGVTDAPPPKKKGGGGVKLVLGLLVVLVLLCLGGGGIGGLAWYLYSREAGRIEVDPADLGPSSADPADADPAGLAPGDAGPPKLDTGAPAPTDPPAAADKPGSGSSGSGSSGSGSSGSGSSGSGSSGSGSSGSGSSGSGSSGSGSSGSGSSGSAASGSAAASSGSGSSTSTARTSSGSSSSSSSGSSSSSRSSSGSTGSTGSTASSAASAPSSATTDPTLVAGPFPVRFVFPSAEATIQCGDSQQATFAGTGRMQFSGITTCRVLMGGAQGVVQLTQEATVTCTVSGDRVACTTQ